MRRTEMYMMVESEKKGGGESEVGMCTKFNFLPGRTENQEVRLRSVPNWTASTLMNVIRRRQR
jgi:hypothetical protein